MKKELSAYGTILTPNDVKTILGIGRNSVYKLLKENVIRNFKICSKYKIPRIALEEFIEIQTNAELRQIS